MADHYVIPVTTKPRPIALTDWMLAMVPEHCPVAFNAMHHEMATAVDAGERGRRHVWIGPRGSAKSTIITFGDVLRQVCEGRERYTVVLSKSDNLAMEHVRTVRVELEENERLRDVYGSSIGRGDTWNQHEIRLRNGCLVRALGSGSQIRGRKQKAARPSRIVLDDPESDSIIYSDKEREHNWNWLTREVVPAGGPGCNLDVLGTPIHPQCIVWKLREHTGWSPHLFKSLIRLPENLPLWARWADVLRDFSRPNPVGRARVFYDDNRDEMDVGAEVMWPEWKPLYDLMLARETLGLAAFNSEEQMEPLDPRAMAWPMSYFDHGQFWFNDWPASLIVRSMYLDPAMGRDAHEGDYSAFVLLGEDANEVLWCEAFMLRIPATELAAFGCDLMKGFNPDAFSLEAVVFQELLAPFFEEEILRRQLLQRVIPDFTPTSGRVRIHRLSEPLARHRIRFRRTPGTEELVQQLKAFPTHRHDDGPVALEGAWRLAIHLRT